MTTKNVLRELGGFRDRPSAVSATVAELIRKRDRIDQQIRLRDQIQSHGSHALALLFGKTVMVAEQVQPRLHRCEHLVDLRLSGIRSTAARIRTKRLRGFVREENVDHAAERLAPLDVFAHEVPTLVCELGGFRASLPGMRKIVGRRLVPGRSERSAEAGDLDHGLALVVDVDGRTVIDVEQVLRQIAGRDRVEVVVVPVNPVDARAERLVAAVLVGDVADAQPERDVGMRSDDGARRVERAVDVSESAYLGDAGTSRSALSQMKSLLL